MLTKVSNKRKLKAYLDNERHSYPQIFENSPDILLFFIDLKGIIVNIRGGGNKVSGIKDEDFIGKKV